MLFSNGVKCTCSICGQVYSMPPYSFIHATMQERITCHKCRGVKKRKKVKKKK